MNKKLQASDLAEISRKTLSHYEERAEKFWQGTRDHDVTQNYRALLEYLPGPGPYRILDFGCGPGRDLKYFSSHGHEAIGLEGAPRFCQMAQQYSGCKVLQQDFLKLDLPNAFFDGIFANASLFHIPSQEFPRVLRELAATLKPEGILFASNPRGNQEAWYDRRYGYFMEFEEYQKNLTGSGFKVLTHYYRPEGKPRDEQDWLAVVAQKV